MSFRVSYWAFLMNAFANAYSLGERFLLARSRLAHIMGENVAEALVVFIILDG